MAGNLIIEGSGDLFDKCPVVGLDVRQSLGHIGEAEIHFETSSSYGSAFKLHSEFQETLGNRITCSIGDWKFIGRAESLRYESTAGRFNLLLRDEMAVLDGSVESLVFSSENQMLSHIIKSRIPEYHLQGSDKSINLAIQYQESTLKFIKRLLGQFGYQIWCDAGVIYAGSEPSSEESRILYTGRDILDFSLVTELGPESVEIKTFEYDAIDGGQSEKPELNNNGHGELQKSMTQIRRELMPIQRLHTVGEDISVKSSGVGTEFLRRRADGRMKIRGRILFPVALGGMVKISNAESSESCMVKKLTGKVDSTGRGSWEIEAVSAEAILDTCDIEPSKMYMSLAVVDKAKNTWDRDRVCASDSMNRVCVTFPWDSNASRPFLRLLMPSWGDGHMHYIRPEVGDAVIVVWGQPDIDPFVVGAINAGTGSSKGRRKINDPDISSMLRTIQGLSLTTDKKSIVLRNESNKGNSSIEIEPDALTVKSKTGSSVIIDGDTIRLDAGDGTKIEMKPGEINLSASKIELSTKSLNIK